MKKDCVRRTTLESDIVASIGIHKHRISLVSTGISFLSYVTTIFCLFWPRNKLCCLVDLLVDYHHTYEDVGML